MNAAAQDRFSELAQNKIIVALDVDDAAGALEIVDDLEGVISTFKVGLQLFTSAGPEIVRELVSRDLRVFLDLKFHDIPNTVAKVSIEAARLGVWMFNVHAAGGRDMMARAYTETADACGREGLTMPRVIAVTVLTSSNDHTLAEAGVTSVASDQVARLATLTEEAGLDGVVASAREIDIIRSGIPRKDFLIVTPGIRPSGATNDDQKRVMTPGSALSEGADHLVIGRPITAAPDRRKAALEIIREIEESSNRTPTLS